MTERLTKPTIGCFEYDLAKHKHKIGEFAENDAFFNYNMAVRQLGHYEDLNLSPAEIAEKLKELVEYKQLEDEGRLVRLPCKVGDMVYKLCSVGRRRNGTKSISAVGSMGKVCISRQSELIIQERPCVRSDYALIGKTVFLTREAAENALKGEK